VSLTSGLLAAYLTAFIMVPGIEYLRESRGKSRPV
jgi:hypothetical protein